MRKLWIVAGIILVVIGLSGMTSLKGLFGKPLATFEKTWKFGAGELRDLNVQSDYRVNVTFVKSTDGSNSVHVKGQGRDKMIDAVQKTDLADGRLTLDLREPRKFFPNIFDFGSGRVEEEIVVTLAESTSLRNLGFDMDSGSLTLNDASADAANIKMDSGSIEINRLSAGKLNVKADSGSIRGSGIQADSTVTADSGSIKLEHVTGHVKLHADSGSVKLYKDDTADTEIQADSGSVYVHLPDSFAGYFDLRSDSGSITAPDSKRETKDLVKVRADSGSIKIEQGN